MRRHLPEAVCTSAQTVTVGRVSIQIRRPARGDNHMLFIAGVGIVLLAVAIIHRMGMPPSGVEPPNLGWMSERWLAEHRASHSQ